MISEATFSEKFTSFWRFVTPNMDRFVRQVNLALVERFCLPIVNKTLPNRRALINEIAFELALLKLKSDDVPRRHWPDVIKGDLFDDVRAKLARFEGQADELLAVPSEGEIEEVELISDNLSRFVIYHGENAKVQYKPDFRGCGWIDQAEGDILIDKSLVEVKAGARNFRGIDFRQILTYGALNYASRERRIENLILFNPRTGLYWTGTPNEVAIESSGKPASELFEEIVFFVSSGDVSR